MRHRRGAFVMLLAGTVTGVTTSRVRTREPEAPKYLRFVNHALGVTDEFADKGAGFTLGAIMFPPHAAAVVILGIGALA